jgi:hypothetical protein
MRFLDEDTFIQSKPGSKMRRLPAEDGEEDIDLEEEEEEDELDEIERAIRTLNSKSAVKKKSQGAGAEPSFKTDSFVTVEGLQVNKWNGKGGDIFSFQDHPSPARRRGKRTGPPRKVRPEKPKQRAKK